MNPVLILCLLKTIISICMFIIICTDSDISPLFVYLTWCVFFFYYFFFSVLVKGNCWQQINNNVSAEQESLALRFMEQISTSE